MNPLTSLTQHTATELTIASDLRPASRRQLHRTWCISLVAIALMTMAQAATAQSPETDPKPRSYPELPTEIPAKFEHTRYGFDHEVRDVMIPMRDGVKLHTLIFVPKGAQRAPMLLTRTPYDANSLTGHAESSHLGPRLNGYDNALEVILEGGYIRVVQDVRGKHGSEGDYVVNRPIRGPLNPTPVDHATDTWDTVDWLSKNVPESNGNVGILGISYDGFLPLMALFDPHPALKVSVPMNPMVDGWIGDDWFHNGAFRQLNMSWIYNQLAAQKLEHKWWTSHFDAYDTFMEAGTAGELGRRRGFEQLGFWRKLLEHPTYDEFWREQAVDKLLAKQPLKIPVMLVHGLWDQEDIYGAPAVYKAIEPKDTNNDKVFLVMGPWNHGQQIEDASALGAIKFGSDTGLYFRREILAPFLAHYLQDNPPPTQTPPVIAFETGTNKWRQLKAWPDSGQPDSSIHSTPLYLRSGLKLAFTPPADGEGKYSEYVSDPAKPVPFQPRPVQPMGYGGNAAWPKWLVNDQREASGRPDVVVFVSDVLTEPLKISGEPIVNLTASTSGTDSDWVVKLIDVYPDEVPAQPEMGGYQLMVATDIFRGRYRENLAEARPLAADQPLKYRFGLPTSNHVFLPGHRLMVQVQSSWFPLYDRNPQKFVESIFWAKPEDFQQATQRIFHTPDHASMIELPVVKKNQ
ncbi:MAG: CocE/NonD family hydrolase [Pirellulales bacterium]